MAEIGEVELPPPPPPPLRSQIRWGYLPATLSSPDEQHSDLSPSLSAPA
jgi:hypothetical protein